MRKEKISEHGDRPVTLCLKAFIANVSSGSGNPQSAPSWTVYASKRLKKGSYALALVFGGGGQTGRPNERTVDRISAWSKGSNPLL